MRNLLQANFRRLWRSKIFWIVMIFEVLAAMFICGMLYRDVVQLDAYVALDGTLFLGTTILGFALAAFYSLFLGADYSDGTIRNKLVVGCSRQSIYLANLLVTAAASLIVYSTLILTTMVLGLVLFEAPQIAASTLLVWTALGVAMTIAHSAIFMLIAMLCPNRTYTAVLCLALALGLLAAGAYVGAQLAEPEMVPQVTMDASMDMTIHVDGENIAMEMVPNPRYLTGFSRKTFEFLDDLNPTSQFFQLAYRDVARPVRVLLCDCGIVLLTTILGLLGFSKKDVK